MANNTDGLALRVHLSYQVLHFSITAQLIWRPAAWQYQRKELVSFQVLDQGVRGNHQAVFAMQGFQVQAGGQHLGAFFLQAHGYHVIFQVFHAFGD